MITRTQYMNKEVTFEEYYREIYKEADISFKHSIWLPRIKKALAAGDEHLNTIPLLEWDALGSAFFPRLRTVFKNHGDFWSLAGQVCALKQAARDAVKEDEIIIEAKERN